MRVFAWLGSGSGLGSEVEMVDKVFAGFPLLYFPRRPRLFCAATRGAAGPGASEQEVDRAALSSGKRMRAVFVQGREEGNADSRGWDGPRAIFELLITP